MCPWPCSRRSTSSVPRLHLAGCEQALALLVHVGWPHIHQCFQIACATRSQSGFAPLRVPLRYCPLIDDPGRCRRVRETRQRTRTSFPFTAGRSGVGHLSVHSILCDVSESFAGRSKVLDPAPLSRLPTPSVGCVGCVGLRHMKDARWGPALTKSPERARRWTALPFDSPTSSSPRLR